MKSKVTGILLLVFTLSIISCNRDREAPVINITSPQDNQIIAPGETFNLQATVTDNEGLASISLTDGFVTQDVEEFDELTSHSLNYTVTIGEDSQPGELTITINATDLEANESEAFVKVVVQ